MTQTLPTVASDLDDTIRVRLAGAYDIREAVKANGGIYDGASRTWTMEPYQWRNLLIDVEDSSRRSNKRDRALYVGYQGVTVTVEARA